MLDWIPHHIPCYSLYHCANSLIFWLLFRAFSVRYFSHFITLSVESPFKDEVCWKTFLICESFLHFHDRSSGGRRALVDGDHKSYFKISSVFFFSFWFSMLAKVLFQNFTFLFFLLQFFVFTSIKPELSLFWNKLCDISCSRDKYLHLSCVLLLF